MKGRRHTPEQVVCKLREADGLLGEGFELPDVLKELEVSEATYHRWRARYGGMKADDVKRLKELEAENAQVEADRRRPVAGHRGAQGAGEGKLLSPARRRRAVLALRDRLGMSERRACRLAGQHRSTQRHELVVADDDAALRAELRRISRERPRWGYRRAHRLLLDDGWSLNIKRTRRVWREEGLRVPRKRRKRQRLGTRPCQPSGYGRSGRITCGRSIFSSIRLRTGTTSSCCTWWMSSPARRWRSSAIAGSTPMRPSRSSPGSCRARDRARVFALRQRAGDDRQRDQRLVPLLAGRERVHRARLTVAERLRRESSAAASATSSWRSSCSRA